MGPDAVRLQYTPWRVSCARCGVKVRAGAVADGSSVFTAAVEELAAYLAQVTDPTTVSRLLEIPPDGHVALSAGSASSCRVPAGRRVRRRRSHGTVGGSRVYKEAIRGRQNGNPGSKGEPIIPGSPTCTKELLGATTYGQGGKDSPDEVARHSARRCFVPFALDNS